MSDKEEIRLASSSKLTYTILGHMKFSDVSNSLISLKELSFRKT